VISEVGVALIEVSVDCGLGVIHRVIVTVLNYGARHTAENRLDHVKELSPCRKRRGLDGWALAAGGKIVFVDVFE
jgi:hypothetical protein